MKRDIEKIARYFLIVAILPGLVSLILPWWTTEISEFGNITFYRMGGK